MFGTNLPMKFDGGLWRGELDGWHPAHILIFALSTASTSRSIAPLCRGTTKASYLAQATVAASMVQIGSNYTSGTNAARPALPNDWTKVRPFRAVRPGLYRAAFTCFVWPFSPR